MLPNGLPHASRLHLKRDFKRIIEGGIKSKTLGLVLWAQINPSSAGRVRFAVVVSKRLGPAVARNRSKRILREAFRTFRTHLVPGADVVVCPQQTQTTSSLHAAQEALKTVCQQAKLLKNSPRDIGYKG